MLKDPDFGGRILRWYDLPRPSESSEEQRSLPNAVSAEMFSRMVIRFLVFGIFCSAPLLAQQKPADPASSGLQEFPVIMRQNVTAGKLLSEPRFRQSWWWEPWEMVRYSQRTPFFLAR